MKKRYIFIIIGILAVSFLSYCFFPVVFFQNKETSFLNVTRLKMKSLSRQQIENYLEMDQPFDCAGSYKIEKHGISLMDKIETDDFTAIQGLPLIQLAHTLESFGYQIPRKE